MFKMFLVLLVLVGLGVVGLNIWRAKSKEKSEAEKANNELALADLRETSQAARASAGSARSEPSPELGEEARVVVFHPFVNREAPSPENLSGVFGGGSNSGAAYVDLNTNTVYVSVLESEQAQAALVLASMDKAQELFAIDAVMLVASLREGEQFSLEWIVSNVPGFATGGLGVATESGVRIDAAGLGIALDRLQEKNRVEILSRPALMVTGGESAVLSAGREIAVPVTDVQDGNARTSIQFRQVAMKLDVRVRRLAGGIRLDLQQVNDDVSGEREIDGNAVPEISSQSWSSIMVVEPGEWFAVGGVRAVETRESDSRGWLSFLGPKAASESVLRREIGLLVRVRPGGAEKSNVWGALAPEVPSLRVVPVAVPVDVEFPPETVERPVADRKWFPRRPAGHGNR